jgi:hypothetical protein
MSETAETLDADLSRAYAQLLQLSGSIRTGSELRSFFDDNFPSIDIRAVTGILVGSGALSKFLRDHFAAIVHPVGKRGGDTLYQIGSIPPPDLATLGTRRNLWTAFANPSMGLQLVVDRTTGAVSCHPISTELGVNSIALPPIARAEFQQITEDFTDTLPRELRDALRPLMESGDYSSNWLATLRNRDTDAALRWGLFRIEAITELFRNRLQNASLPPEQVELCVRDLLAEQQAAHNERIAARSLRKATSTLINLRLDAGSGNTDDALLRNSLSPAKTLNSPETIFARSVACLAIGNMSLEEIRKLRVPLGAIIDAGFAPR